LGLWTKRLYSHFRIFFSLEWRFGPIGFPADCPPRLDMGSGYGIDNIALPHHRALDRHRDAAVTSLIPALSCRSCRSNAPFAELVRLSRTSIADEMREEHRRQVLAE